MALFVNGMVYPLNKASASISLEDDADAHNHVLVKSGRPFESLKLGQLPQPESEPFAYKGLASRSPEGGLVTSPGPDLSQGRRTGDVAPTLRFSKGGCNISGQLRFRTGTS